MQEQSEHSVNVSTRLQDLRSLLGMTWSELAAHIGISRVMLHYLRTGAKPLGVKLDYRLRQIESEIGLFPKRGRESSAFIHPSVPFEKWMNTLRRRWQRKESSRNEIALAVKVLFPDHATEILAWLAKRTVPSKSK